MVKPIPEGFHSVTPYLMVKKSAKVAEFMAKAFGAKEIHRIDKPDGTIGHAQYQIGDSMVMLSEACDKFDPMPMAIYLYVTDSDATYKKAVQAGATSIMEPADQFYGDRHGGVRDPSGNLWWIATHKEDIAPDELRRRTEKFMREQAPSAAAS
jgi:PhnB protein